MSSKILSPIQFPVEIRVHAKRERRNGHLGWIVRTSRTEISGKRTANKWLRDHGFIYVGHLWSLLDVVALGGKVSDPVSYKPEVIADSTNLFCDNGQQFATEAEALQAAKDLHRRWVLVTDVRVVASLEPVNYEIVDNVIRSIKEAVNA